MPIGMDHRDVYAYIQEFLRQDRPECRGMGGSLKSLVIFNSAVKVMERGEGISLTVSGDGRSIGLQTPGTARRAGALLGDGQIFDIGEKKTWPGSLKLKLSGTRNGMRATVHRSQLGDLLRYLQENKHVGKFYVPEPNPEILRTLKERYVAARRQGREAAELAEVAP